MWDLFGPGIETVPPVLASGFFTTKPPETPDQADTKPEILVILYIFSDLLYQNDTTDFIS